MAEKWRMLCWWSMDVREFSDKSESLMSCWQTFGLEGATRKATLSKPKHTLSCAHERGVALLDGALLGRVKGDLCTR
jgi:hypothetical protein